MEDGAFCLRRSILSAQSQSWFLKAPGEAEAELAHLNSTGVIDAILSDDVDNFLFGAKIVIRKYAVPLYAYSLQATHFIRSII